MSIFLSLLRGAFLLYLKVAFLIRRAEFFLQMLHAQVKMQCTHLPGNMIVFGHNNDEVFS